MYETRVNGRSPDPMDLPPPVNTPLISRLTQGGFNSKSKLKYVWKKLDIKYSAARSI